MRRSVPVPALLVAPLVLGTDSRSRARQQAFWFPDVTLLAAYIVGFTILSYLALVVLVKERR